MRTAYCTAAFFALVFIFTTFVLPCHGQTYYGITSAGGSAGYGAIISFNVATGLESVVWSFDGPPYDGASPFGSLVYDSSNGLFYAMTAEGGSNDLGTIISFDPATNTDSLVWSFTGSPTDGHYPEGSLVYDPANGLFYGMTQSGGKINEGTIISFNPATNTDSLVWSFGGAPSDGDAPAGDLLYDPTNGLFYGMTEGGGTAAPVLGAGGTIFSFDPVTNKDSVLWSLDHGTDGSNPGGNLVYDAGTALFYGMTNTGGNVDTPSGYGTIISFNPSTNAESVVWNFAGAPSDGEYPNGSLVYDTSNGSFYGMSNNGGAYSYGAIIRFDPSTNKESLVWSLGNGNDGSRPLGNLVYNAGNGLLYGMIQMGGTNGSSPYDGTIISFNPVDDSEKVLWDFGSDTDGSQPWGSLVVYPPTIKAGINSNIPVLASVNIYPNPGNGVFTITGLSTGQMLEIYNDLGERISSSIAGNATEQMDISAQANGMYVVRASATDGTTVAERKVVKVN